MNAKPLNRVRAMKSCTGVPSSGGGRAVASHAEICTTDLPLITPVQLKFFQPVVWFGHHTRMVLAIEYLPSSCHGRDIAQRNLSAQFSAALARSCWRALLHNVLLQSIALSRALELSARWGFYV